MFQQAPSNYMDMRMINPYNGMQTHPNTFYPSPLGG